MAAIFFSTDFFFFIIPLKPSIYRFSGSASLLALSVFACNRKRGYGGHLDFLIAKFLFLPKVKVKGQGQRFLKMLVNAIT